MKSVRTEPGLATRAVLPILDGMRALGLNVETLLFEAGIPGTLLGDPEARVPHGAMIVLWSGAATAAGDGAIGFRVATAVPLEAFDVHAYAFLSSPTLREGYRRASRYQRLIHDATELTLSDDDPAVLRHALPGGRPVPRPPAELLLTVYVRIGRAATGIDWAPSEVRFAHAAPSFDSGLAGWFRAPIQYGAGENALVLPSATLDAPSVRSDPALVSILDRYASTELAARPRLDSASAAARAHLEGALSGGDVSSTSTARALGLSVRTLGRRLAEEGTTFGELLAQLRHERALALLADGRTSIAEVAFLLGFAELSSFYRAFRRAAGLTPAAYRRALLSHRRPGAKRQGS